MIYTCSNGCLFYYDRILYRWCIADPTMLFLLGLDAILSGDTSHVSNYIVIPREYTDSSNNTIPYRYFEIFDNIYSYLSDIGTVEDLDTYLKFDCNGLKLLISDLTGTGSDKTVPVLFNNDINRKLIDVTKYSYRIPESDRINLSYYDMQAKIIDAIFEGAGYNESPLDLIDINSAYADSDTIKEHNEAQTLINDERLYNSNIFKLLDYKSMYSYALGILYGCRCLGYNPLLIWRINPSLWYDGKFKNLVSTAWTVFRFYRSTYISEFEEDPNLSVKYQSIAYNKLWNFDDDITRQSLQSNPIMIDEVSTSIFSIKPVDSSIIDQFPNPDSSLIEYLIQSTQALYSQRLLGDSTSVSDIVFITEDAIIKCYGSNIPIDGKFIWTFKVKADDSVIKTYTIETKVSYIDESGSTIINLSSDPPLVEDSFIRDFLATAEAAFSDHPESTISLTAAVTINDTSVFDEITLLSRSSDSYYLHTYVRPPGKYLTVDSGDLQWNNIDNLLYDVDTKYGMIDYASLQNPIIRYLGKDKITIYPAHVWNKDLEYYKRYLSPYANDPLYETNYFIPTGAVGWADFIISSIDPSSGHLSIVPVDYLSLDQSRIHTVNTSRGRISYYECVIGGNPYNEEVGAYYIYGVFDSVLSYEYDDNYGDFRYTFNNVSDHFKYILSKDLFNKYYIIIE